MRHYIRYDSDGALIGCDTHSRGWPLGADPRDPDTTNGAALRVRGRRLLGKVPYEGWAAYDCPCGRSVVSCQCAYRLLPDHYFNGTVLFPKPALTIEVDGAVILDGKLSAVPNSQVLVVLKAATPDGHEVVVSDFVGNLSPLLTEPLTMSFNGGVTESVGLTVPPQGISSSVRGISRYVRGFSLTLQGWA